MGWIGNQSDVPCPFINAEDPRCGGRLTLRALDQAYTYCLGGYLSCPAYHRMSWEQQARETDDLQSADRQGDKNAKPARPHPLASSGRSVVTVAGRPVAPADARRPTPPSRGPSHASTGRCVTF